MNEVTKIHLGRQPFTISVEAHSQLKHYLSAIQKQVGDKSVSDEIELRMAELLSEHGISGDKVILVSDVDYLKSQLGDPKDFKDDEERSATDDKQADKRFFRDQDNAMLAGVAAGLAAYFNIDVLLVRIIFLIGVFTGGWGILLYIALWLLVPPARTPSERLQMQGKAVTVDSLKEAVERADLHSAAQRANSVAAPIINKMLSVALKIIGVFFILGSLAVIFGLIAIKVYMMLHNGQLFEENFFPIGTTEQLLANTAIVLAGLVALFALLTGMAFFRRRWPIGGWITGILVGLFVIGLAVSVALAGDVGPRVRSRVDAASQTYIRNVKPFSSVSVPNGDVDIRYEMADHYAVKMTYVGKPDLSKISTNVTNGTLTINTQNFDLHRHCDMLCLFPAYNLVLTVESPNATSFDYPIAPKPPRPPAVWQ
jgi:phage shock protein PspC (stress-responsive transcriptional regulator)